MTLLSTRLQEGRIGFEAATEHPFTFAVNANGAASYVADGLQLRSAVDIASSVGGTIVTLPWTIANLKMVEFQFKCELLTSGCNFCCGVSTAYNATYGSLTNAALFNVNTGAGARLNTYTDDGTTATTYNTGLSLAINTWYRARIDFWQKTKTNSPGVASVGYQPTFSITDSNGYTRRVSAACTTHDMSAVSTVAMSPYLSVRNATGAPLGATNDFWVKEIKYELMLPA